MSPEKSAKEAELDEPIHSVLTQTIYQQKEATVQAKTLRKKHLQTPPWQIKSRCVLFVCAIIFAIWATVNMPVSTKSSTHTQGSINTENALNAQTFENIKADEITQNISPNDLEQERIQTKQNQKSAESQTGERMSNMRHKKEQTDIEKILVKAKYFLKLFLYVGIAAFLGSIIEARRWHLVLVRGLVKLTNAARLPEIVSLSMATAFFSNAAANSVLVSSHANGEIRTSALIAGGMVNSYLAYISHSLRVMYPVLAAIGLPGALYFTIQFSGGLFVIFCVLLWNRWYIIHHPSPLLENYALDSDIAKAKRIANKEKTPWSSALRLANTRAFTLIFRMVYITMPLMLGVEWLLKSGFFDFWENAVPDQVSKYFKGEMVTIVLSQMGGLIQSSAVSANLRAEGIINNAQILLAMLVGSAVGNPVRMLRRNLPSALALFPPKVACTIVFGMQFSRLMVTICASYFVILYMSYMF